MQKKSDIALLLIFWGGNLASNCMAKSNQAAISLGRLLIVNLTSHVTNVFQLGTAVVTSASQDASTFSFIRTPTCGERRFQESRKGLV